MTFKEYEEMIAIIERKGYTPLYMARHIAIRLIMAGFIPGE
jgi:hypothetical protein